MYIKLGLFINGKWKYNSEKYSDVINPADESILGKLPHATKDDLQEAVESSLAGFKVWRDISTEEKGDFLIFNRRLCHRGGKNISNDPRNSLIIQCIWLWGIGQEIINSSKIFERLESNSEKYKNLDDKEKESFRLRLEFPYPKNVKESA